MKNWLRPVVVAAIAATGFVSQAAPSTKPASLLPEGVKAVTNIKYGEAPGKANLLDVYLPEAEPTKPMPLVVWIHGGGWCEGNKEGCPAVAGAPRGYVVASLNYRLSQEAIYPAQLHDCKGAIRYLRAHAKEYHIDPDRIGVWGASAGGHLVALLGTTGDTKEMEGTVGGNLDQSSRVQCVCDWFGPTDMNHYYPPKGDPNYVPMPKKSAITQLFGGPIEERIDLIAKGNPITFISKVSAPILIMHGAKDTLVPLAQSEVLNDALKAAGVECTLVVLPLAGHGNGFGLADILKVAEFFDQHLKPVAAPAR